MTTIAFDGKTLATDSLRTDGSGMVCGYMNKIHSIPGGVIACAGNTADIASVIEWLTNKGDRPRPESFAGIVLMDDGSFYELDVALSPYTCVVPTALGSGAPYALAALHLGHTSEEAIQVAIKLDVWSGGSINSIQVNQ